MLKIENSFKLDILLLFDFEFQADIFMLEWSHTQASWNVDVENQFYIKHLFETVYLPLGRLGTILVATNCFLPLSAISEHYP